MAASFRHNLRGPPKFCRKMKCYLGVVVRSGTRYAEEKALGCVNAEVAKGRKVARTFDSFCNDGRS